ncbi:3-oxoacyl-[acyl-carrier-protein] synthase III [Rhodothalassium salexigens DSM 2132]|uniref:Beta-ketoacyl-[acyl-carrier-protein] synthase III n=1 Tax=Rhodothalassium salexigens DSM 2132 TaxID=1188247 RepID=A0A4R2PQR9_RHOSA|nr:beta-ketoacyl-ACP synthase III [Rhodothalassium salexigens]MBB4209975.1 3-oxoacyl-[acyl-carrier-protein] synthase-3 [Rhodothalassium salexigens DSM 2132]MBK1637653.1 3-oxoacyl-ACP synthase [Rhodothalassium salexigens DSM 2132]TCP38140.1 3-oxoacyl-[acyl-carrier-protein] synthase III [Rhodothalassium salexigens DSM 2132]
MTLRRSVAVGCGAYLPERCLTNHDLAQSVDTSDEWIVERTGIRQRHIAAEGELTSDLGIAAARRALDHAGLTIDAIDLIVVATATPDETFPATATRIQAALGMTHGAAFDVQAVCSGFIYALTTADAFIQAGKAERALVIGAETFSRILDWQDRATCVLFGDGAGAVVLEARDQPGDTGRDRGILASHLRSDGRHHDLLYVDGGPSSTKTVGHLRMKGREVFRHAVVNLTEAVEKTAERAGLSVADIDWVVPHQANKRILDGTAKKLGIAPDKVVSTVDRHANTSAASVPLALATAVGDGRIQSGDLVMLEAMGGGFTWGACLLRW